MENEPKVEEEKIEELEDDYVEPKKNIKEIINEMQDPKDPKINLVVNNRIIDDYSKYLQNLDSNSAYYDAKSRSMSLRILIKEKFKMLYVMGIK